MASESASFLSFDLQENEKIYFASDFHLGAPDLDSSLEREKKIIRWLKSIEHDAKAIFFVGDIFDFWFEYKNVIPKGSIRFIGKVAELVESGVEVFFHTGNHDLWMKNYFPETLGISVFHHPVKVEINGRSFFVAHGDGLGPGDNKYKFIKKIFTNRLFQWLFYWLHPNIGVSMAIYWSNHSRKKDEKYPDEYRGEDEMLIQFIRKQEEESHFDIYVFGHRHIPVDYQISDKSRYFNLGEWIKNPSFLEVNEKTASLKVFDN